MHLYKYLHLSHAASSKAISMSLCIALGDDMNVSAPLHLYDMLGHPPLASIKTQLITDHQVISAGIGLKTKLFLELTCFVLDWSRW